LKNDNTRLSLIQEGLKVLITHGYDGIGLAAILGAAGVPKGSFYYFFKSKEDFVGEVLVAYEQHYLDLRDSIFKDATRSPAQRLRDYFDELERLHRREAPLGGCLYGVLAQTASVRSEDFRNRLAKVFKTWTAQIEQLLKDAQAAGELHPDIDAIEAAAFIIEAYEGALIRMKVDGGLAAFARFKRFALQSVLGPETGPAALLVSIHRT
jgi:TetR/AcrR family transcriptional repressor of nem operon